MKPNKDKTKRGFLLQGTVFDSFNGTFYVKKRRFRSVKIYG